MGAYFLAIPTYWTHPAGRGAETITFDHPTPLDAPGTLRRTLLSLAPLVEAGVAVGVVAAAAAPELAPQVEARVRELLASPPLPFPVVLLAGSHLAALRNFVSRRGQEGWLPLLSLEGYGAIRNMSLVMANVWGAEAVVSLDDDEVVEDPGFLRRIAADLAVLARRQTVFGLAGLYVNADGGVLAAEPQAPWAMFWPKLRCMNQGFTALLAAATPLPLTPLGLGGNLVIPAALYRRLPFDPQIPRGEDVDYLMNARCWGFPFFCDPELRIRHLPPAKPHPTWLRLRQDVVRFAYARRKLREQEPRPGMVRVTAQELMPYPGTFLLDDLEERAFRSHTLLALAYMAEGDPEGARQTLKNLQLLEAESRSSQNAFRTFLDLVDRWRELQTWLARPEVAVQARQAVWGAA